MTKNIRIPAGGHVEKSGQLFAGSRYLRRFKREEDGGLIAFSLYILITMLLVTGLAVDLMRAETHRSRLQATLDRAVLAGASLTQTLNSKEVVLDYFDKAGLGNYIDADDVTVVETNTSKVVTATAQMNMNTYFLKMLGVTSLQAPAGGQAEESVSDVEVSLIVDVSGSMGQNAQSGGTKIQVLKAAAKEFVYLMQCDPDASAPFDGICVVEENTVSISMIPYNHQVIAGESLIQQFDITEEHNASSCVDFDADDYLTVSITLAPAAPLPGHEPTVKRSTQQDFWSGYAGYDSTEPHDSRRECSPNIAPYNNRTIIPYEDDYEDLEDAIDDLYAGGNTSIDLATKWGAALLAPEFRDAVTSMSGAGSIVPEFVGRPFDYDRARTRKVIVLMTDGKNTSKIWTRDAYRDGMSPFFVVDHDHNTNPPGVWDADDDHLSLFNATRDANGQAPYYDVNHDNWKWSPHGGGNAAQISWNEVWERYNTIKVGNLMNDASMAPSKWYSMADYDYTSMKDPRLHDICNAAKAEGILIYTIGFETSLASNIVLETCASSGSHHFDVSGLDLTAAFNSIARDIHELRLTN